MRIGNKRKENVLTEIELLDETLKLIDDSGTVKAYEYLVSNLNRNHEWSSQVYNFLYCLAATSGKLDEAVSWLKEAIVDRGLWYRPEVFEDDDLDAIRSHSDFASCVEISNSRYKEELKSTMTEFSWEKKIKDNLLVVLHGNQQNNDISKMFWSEFNSPNFQIEYLQSSEIDSFQFYRWSDDGDGPVQLSDALRKVEGESYNKTVLAGFSAGCNTILKAIHLGNINCNMVILFSPWMPVVESKCDEVIMSLKDKEIEVVIICGELDEDCMPQCRLFEERAMELGFEYKRNYMKDMSHEYPKNLVAMVGEYL